MKKYGVTRPENFFVIDYSRTKSPESEGLKVGAFVYCRLYDEETDEILANVDCVLHLPNGDIKRCKSDEQGFVRVANLPHGDTFISLDIARGDAETRMEEDNV